jgi:mRNA interferase RelE/StbE
MTYSLFILRRAQKELAHLPRESYERVAAAILRLAEDPRPTGCRKLTGRDAWRIRVGAFRAIYEIDEEHATVTILHVGRRRDVYR